MKRIMSGMTAVLVVLLAETAQAATYHVDVKWGGPFNGTATEPFQTLAQARVAYTNGSGHTIKVAIGEYKSTMAGGFEEFGTAGYDLLGIVGNWYGGYVGHVSGSTFDWTTRTLPNADTLNPATVTVINLTNANSRAFYSTAYQHTLNFTGFVFRDPYVTQASYHGGALYVGGGMDPAVVQNCVFINNRTTGNGGALWHSGRGGTSTDCVFIGNTALGSGGGARIAPGNTTQTIRRFTFLNNTAAVNGGGLWVEGSDVAVDQSHFEGNAANGSGDNGGGAISTASSTITRTVIVNNRAPNGWGGAVGRKQWQNTYMTLENCLVISNSAANFTVVSYANHSLVSLSMRHVTLVGNTGGGAITKAGDASFNATLNVRNCIVAANGSKGIEYTDAGSRTVDYNCVRGHTQDYVGFTAGANDIALDPLFVNAASGDFHLQKTSPCIETGTHLGVTTDLDGTVRFTAFFPDMGCYEQPQFPGVLHLDPALRTDSAETRAEFLLANKAALPTHAFFVLDNVGDQGTADMANWWKQSGTLGVQPQGQPFGYWFTGLSSGTTYFYRCIVSNSYDVVWGPPMSFTTPAAGTTRTWTGATGDGLASTPGNWSGTAVPTWSDAIVLDSTSNSNMTWNAGTGGLPPGVASWTQTADYTNTVTFNTTYPEYSTTFTLFSVAGNVTLNGGTWTHQGHTSTQNSDATRRYRLRVSVAGDFALGANGKINLFGRGLVNDSMSDTIRGTLGGQRSDETGAVPISNRTTLDSITAPQAVGRGGDWGGSNARYGGGAVWLTVAGASTISGEINARAGTWSNTGITPRSGSGGSIYLRTGTLSGGGLIDASNGDTTSVGGGGRVAVVVTNSTSFGSVGMRAWGGGSGPAAAGTVYKEHNGHGAGQGILVLDNNNQNHANYGQPYYAYGVTLMPNTANGGPVDLGQFAEIIVTNRAILGINTDTVLDWNAVNLSVYGRDASFIAIRGTNNVTWPANLAVDGFTLLLDVDPNATGNWTVKPGGRLSRTFARQSTDQQLNTAYPLVSPLTLTLTGNLAVESGGEITVQRMGYNSNSGPGRQSGNRASSHGGQGGSSDNTGGNPVYGSILFPNTSGSGGQWGSQNFSPAGGRMRLTVTGTTTLDGEINAMPHIANQERASGGSIWMTTGYLAGDTGVINARGRDGALGGGGGRIAVYLTQGNDTGSVTLDARGGVHATNPGAAGTVYVQKQSDPVGGGRISVWNGSRVQYIRAATPIPPATALASDLPPVYGTFQDDLSRSSLDLLARGRARLQADMEMATLSIAADAVLDLGGFTLRLRSATINGASVLSGEHSAVSLGVSQVVDSAGTNGRIIIPPKGSLIHLR